MIFYYWCRTFFKPGKWPDIFHWYRRKFFGVTQFTCKIVFTFRIRYPAFRKTVNVTVVYSLEYFLCPSSHPGFYGELVRNKNAINFFMIQSITVVTDDRIKTMFLYFFIKPIVFKFDSLPETGTLHQHAP